MLKFNFKLLTLVLIAVFCFGGFSHAQLNTEHVDRFEKLIVSPHIAVTLRQGPKAMVQIETSKVSTDKIHIDRQGKTLHLYLTGAKITAKSEKQKNKNGWSNRKSIYEGTEVEVTVTYVALNELAIRGEETIACEGLLKAENFKLKLYGEPKVYFDNVDLDHLSAAIYGESYLEIKAGTVRQQRYVAYGESKINAMGVRNKTAKITAYGESRFDVAVSEELKVTTFGESTVNYKGNPKVDKGLTLGEAKLSKID